ncbi:serine hydrolase domain-containing protein [Actinospica robiniae]|uniref:serine hydrolase domain-containing protein n=1 Tax=Actinospica robiniae TaxID=304901 RepID=UPI00042559EC|nr:serine hydrolase domain-containing protein [Actinospica robiniae]
MATEELDAFVASAASEYGIPGAAVGVWHEGRAGYACHGVTSVANPLAITPDTVFSVGSVSKSFTATAVMRLVADGLIDLDARVREYVPELVLGDEQAAASITVRHLLNHTAGLGVRLVVETGDGDDALAGFVARMNELEQLAPVGERASYSQAGYNLLGRVVEKVTGHGFEEAVAEVALRPLGLEHTTYHLNDVMTGRFAVGHNADADGNPVVAREWKDTRGNNPGGGIASSAADLLAWARFHLGASDAAGAASVLPAAVRESMREQTVELRGSSLGDGFGICWFLRDLDGVRVIGHGGSGNGQFADLQFVPGRDFAVVSLTNAGPGGVAFNQALVRWTLEHYLGVVDKDPEPVAYDAARAAELVGHYEIDAMTLDIATDGGVLTLEVRIKAELRAGSAKELPADYPPFEFGLLAADGDDYIVTTGAFAGQRGFFSRDEHGAIVGCDLAGRMFTRSQGLCEVQI